MLPLVTLSMANALVFLFFSAYVVWPLENHSSLKLSLGKTIKSLSPVNDKKKCFACVVKGGTGSSLRSKSRSRVLFLSHTKSQKNETTYVVRETLIPVTPNKLKKF